MKLAYCMKGNFNGGWGINAFPGLLPCKTSLNICVVDCSPV